MKGEQPIRRVEIITQEQRAADDPRGLERVTIIGRQVFRKIRPSPPGSPGGEEDLTTREEQNE